MKAMASLLFGITLLLTATLARADATTLKTQTGKDMGLTLSSYQYQEPGLMSLKGGKMGLEFHATKALQNDQFIRGDFRYAFGMVDYTSNGTGSKTGDLDLYIEARVLAGKDLVINDAVLSPYAGFGYRYLFHDGRGVSCTAGQCYFGYRRESNYLYLPIGIIHRSSLKGEARLVGTLEYDHLLQGKQISRLSDGGVGYSDVTNNQNRGYGLKLSVMHEKGDQAIGPYAHYWNISRSNVVPEIQNGLPTGRRLVEPENNTIELGFKASRHF